MARTVLDKIGLTLSRNSPTILTGLGVAGLISTAVLAVKATPRALMMIDEEVYNKYPGYKYDVLICPPILNAKETVKLVWKCYVPAAILGGVSIACFVGANSINLRRNAALATAYSLAETTLREYQAKVVETLGERKERKIKDEVYKEKIDKDPPKREEIIFTDHGNTLCFEVTSGRYFRSDAEYIRKVKNQLNEILLADDFVTLNELYYWLGLEQTSIGEDLGWDIQDGLMDIDFSSQLSKLDEPCLIINTNPKYNFRTCGC